MFPVQEGKLENTLNFFMFYCDQLIMIIDSIDFK